MSKSKYRLNPLDYCHERYLNPHFETVPIPINPDYGRNVWQARMPYRATENEALADLNLLIEIVKRATHAEVQAGTTEGHTESLGPEELAKVQSMSESRTDAHVSERQPESGRDGDRQSADERGRAEELPLRGGHGLPAGHTPPESGPMQDGRLLRDAGAEVYAREDAQADENRAANLPDDLAEERD